jgi:hypothetical protein
MTFPRHAQPSADPRRDARRLAPRALVTLSLVLAMCAPALAVTTFDDSVTPDVIFGSGNSNGSFTVDRAGGAELGLRAKIPFTGVIHSNGDGTYSYSLAELLAANPSQRWNFDWAVNTDELAPAGTGTKIDDLTYLLQIDFDPGAGTEFLSFDPITPSVAAPFYDHSIGDHTTANGGGAEAGDAPTYVGLIAANNVLQQSWRHAFFSPPPLPLPPYDPTIPGVYDVVLSAFAPGPTLVASTSIQVVIIDPCDERYVATTGSDAGNDCLRAAEPCATIEHAIDEVCPAGGTINVAAGSYAEGPQLVIDKDISIVGAGCGATVITPTADTSSSGDARGWFLVPSSPGSTFSMSDVTLDGTGFKIWQAIRNIGSGGTFDGVCFTEIKFDESGPSYAGTAMAAFGSGPVDVSNSTFDEIGRIGILYFGTGVSGSVFSGNTYAGKGVGDFLDYMLDISAGAVLQVTGNTVSGNRGVASVDSSTSAGILVSTFFGAGTAALIDLNLIEDNTSGIAIGFDASDTATSTVTCNEIMDNDFGITVIGVDGSATTANDNTITGNATDGIEGSALVGGSVDATSNWWGCAAGPGGGGCDTVTVNVDASSPLGAAPVCVLCVPPASTTDLYVDDGGNDFAGFNDCRTAGIPCATIQHAVDIACDGNTINVAAGSYTEQVLVAGKSVSLVGAGKATTTIEAPVKASRVDEMADHGFGIRTYDYQVGVFGTGSETVNISGFTLDGNLDAKISGPGTFRSQQLTFFNASGTIEENSLIDWQDAGSFGVQGVATLVIGSLTAQTVVVSDNMVSGYQKGGIVAFGSGPVVVTIEDNMVTGAGPITTTAQNGIQISNGAGGSIIGNQVADNNYTPASFCSAGILVFEDGITVRNNVLTGSLCDLLAQSDDNTIEGNQIPAALSFPFSVLGSGNTVTGNLVDSSPFDGMYFDGINNTITCNRVVNNGGAGIYFDSTASFGTTAGTPNTVNMNSIAGNAAGMDASVVLAPPDIDATGNWWGAADGPSDAGGSGATGSGDSVTVNVDFSAFATSVPACVSCTADVDCDNGVACDGVETCNLGTNMCESGTPVVCPTTQCMTGVCLEPSGTCEIVLDGTVCSATPDTCTLDDTCQAGVCVDGGGGDTDADTVCDADDNCPGDPNTLQGDFDNDSVGDVCDDDDVAGFSLRRLKMQASEPGLGRYSAKGEIDATPTPNLLADVDLNGITVIVENQLGLVASFTFTGADCLSLNNKLKCRNGATGSKFNLAKRSAPLFFRVTATVKKQTFTQPLAVDEAYVVRLQTPVDLLDRRDEMMGCADVSGGRTLRCKDIP